MASTSAIHESTFSKQHRHWSALSVRGTEDCTTSSRLFLPVSMGATKFQRISTHLIQSSLSLAIQKRGRAYIS